MQRQQAEQTLPGSKDRLGHRLFLRTAAVLPVAIAIVASGCGNPPRGTIRNDSHDARADRVRPAGVRVDGPPLPARRDSLATPMTAEALAAILSSACDPDMLTAVRFDDCSVVLKGNGQQLMIFIEDDGSSLQAVLPYLGRIPGDPLAVARWNTRRRFGRAYLDDEDGPTMASDLLLLAGMPAATLVTWGQLLIRMAAAFREEVWPQVHQETPCPAPVAD